MKIFGHTLQRIQNALQNLRQPTSERGYRITPEARAAQLYRQMWVDPALQAGILDIRHMDRVDPRVKKLHGRMARSTVKGGLICDTLSSNTRILKRWKQFVQRLELHKLPKLESDCRGLVMEGNLPMQWVLGSNNQIISGVRMPSETLIPQADENGRFKNPAKAYIQQDSQTGLPIAHFALWQLTVGRLSPDNYDDLGSWGRPYLDATRPVWKKLNMTEEDMVIRRRDRAPQRLSHILDGATQEELENYEHRTEQTKGDIRTDFYSNKKGGVTALQGDANLDQIADVVHLLDTFFAGAPAPKGLFGYAADLNRDILEDMKKDYFEEIDALQDTLADVYETGFRLDLLLSGINPNSTDFRIIFKERRTESPNQAADRALKLKALGASKETVWKTAGLEPEKELGHLEYEQRADSPYPRDDLIAQDQPVKITPNNAPKGESMTNI